MNAVSLFAGIGGIDLALERAGIPVVAAVEINKDCRAKLAEHFPQTTLFEDVTKVTGDDLLAAGFVPDGGLLAAGWPCQGNSVAGGRKGLADPRSGLWRHVVRLLAETRAGWFLGENVPGLLSVNGGADIAVVRGDLAQLGYWWAERILDAQHFGVPQRRRRVFFVGRAGDPGGPVKVLLEPESSDGDPATGRAAWPGTAAASDGRTVGTLATTSGGWRVGADEAAAGQLVTAPTITAGWGTNHGAPGYGGKDDAVFAVAFAENGRNEVVESPVAHALSTGGGKPGQGYSAIAYALTSRNDRNDREENWIAHALTAEGADASEDGTGRGTPLVAVPIQDGSIVRKDQNGFGVGAGGDPSYTLDTTGHQGVIAPNTAVRRLTPLECERLQGFPDGWTAGQSDSTRYRQLGNAVAVPCAEWITRRIAKEAAA